MPGGGISSRHCAPRRTLLCAVLLRASPGCTSVYTRSAERSSASLKGTAEPLMCAAATTRPCLFRSCREEIPRPGMRRYVTAGGYSLFFVVVLVLLDALP